MRKSRLLAELPYSVSYLGGAYQGSRLRLRGA